MLENVQGGYQRKATAISWWQARKGLTHEHNHPLLCFLLVVTSCTCVMAWDGLQWPGMAWDALGWPGMAWNEQGRPLMARDGLVCTAWSWSVPLCAVSGVIFAQAFCWQFFLLCYMLWICLETKLRFFATYSIVQCCCCCFQCFFAVIVVAVGFVTPVAHYHACRVSQNASSSSSQPHFGTQYSTLRDYARAL